MHPAIHWSSQVNKAGQKFAVQLPELHAVTLYSRISANRVTRFRSQWFWSSVITELVSLRPNYALDSNIFFVGFTFVTP